MNNYTVFDTETTGLPNKKSNWRTDYMNFPYIVQIAWKNKDSNTIENHIIKPDGWVIPKSSTKIHGISQGYAIANGEDMTTVLDMFMNDLINCNIIVGHNVHFDTSIVSANYMRLARNRQPLNTNIYVEFLENRLSKNKRICTMLKSIKFCGMKHKNGKGVKFPTLIELYFRLFNGTFAAHNAAEDVRATERCYLELVQIGII